MNSMDIFFCINDGYVRYLYVVLVSILENNPDSFLNFHIISRDLSDESRVKISKLKLKYKNFDFDVSAPVEEMFAGLKLNIDYISMETYFRYVIADMYPNVAKGLYLDADIVVNGGLGELFACNLDGYYAAAVSDAWMSQVGDIDYKNKLLGDDLYVNAGVLLLNLDKIRRDGMVENLFRTTRDMAGKIRYQDQDAINLAFRGKIKEIESKFNFCIDNMALNPEKLPCATIIHYNGPRKPWHGKKRKFFGHRSVKRKLRVLNKAGDIWIKYKKIGDKAQTGKVRVGLIIDEFFGGAGTAFGGYGFLARKYICKYIPDKDIKIDVLLGGDGRRRSAKKFRVDGTDLYRMPGRKKWARFWLRRKRYDVYLSIELTYSYVLENEPEKDKKLILWIQDPRPKYEWDEIETVKLFPENNYYNQEIYDLVHDWNEAGRIRWISQGYFLNPKAHDLYRLSADTPIQYLPNPVDIDYSVSADTPKKNQIIYLGRMESVKRGWLFCEIAKQMPEYEFYVLGQAFREKEKNSAIMEKYRGIPNLHFAGHVDGAEKEKFLRESKILVNTSIHEALPVSFLEALAYGAVLVSNRNPEDLTSKFGIWVGDVLGDGFDKIGLYADAIRKLMTDDELRRELAAAAIDYVRRVHNVPRFVRDMKDVIYKEAKI